MGLLALHQRLAFVNDDIEWRAYGELAVACDLLRQICPKGCPDGIGASPLRLAMLYASDVPPAAKLPQLDTMPGSNDGRLGLIRHLPLLCQLLKNGVLHRQMHSATASGKSRLIHSEVANLFPGRIRFILGTAQNIIQA